MSAQAPRCIIFKLHYNSAAWIKILLTKLIRSIYNPTACFASSFYTLYSTVEPTLPVLQPCKPLTASFMPVMSQIYSKSPVDITTDPIVANQFLHYSPTSHTNLTNAHTCCFQYYNHAWSTESNLTVLDLVGCMILKVRLSGSHLWDYSKGTASKMCTELGTPTTIIVVTYIVTPLP